MRKARLRAQEAAAEFGDEGVQREKAEAGADSGDDSAVDEEQDGVAVAAVQARDAFLASSQNAVSPWVCLEDVDNPFLAPFSCIRDDDCGETEVEPSDELFSSS